MARRGVVIGEVYGGVKVLGDSGKRNKSKEILWLCECMSCGKKETLARGYDLKRGDYQSCGCKKSELISENKKVHGYSYESIYKIWDGIKQRCLNPNHTAYKDYGGRGITICKEWEDSFLHFYNDMGDRPSRNHTIERVDNEKGYDPSNCKWATWTEQALNRRKQKDCTSETKGVYQCSKTGKYIARFYNEVTKERTYLGSFDSESYALKVLKEHQSCQK